MLVRGAPRPSFRPSASLVASIAALVVAAPAYGGGGGAVCALDESTLTSSTPATGDRHGFSVSFDGASAAVGAYPSDGAVTGAGAVHVHVLAGGSWSHQAKVVAPDGAALDRFGFDVAIDGDTLVVGAPYDDAAGTESGSAYVFVRTGATWSQQAKLVPQDLAAGHRFGSSVTLQGDTAVAGTAESGAPGAAYVFVRVGGQWALQQKLTIGAAANSFGGGLTLAGETLLSSDTSDSLLAGAVYVFVRNGGTWSQQAKLAPTDSAAFELFGVGTALEGDLAVVGAPLDDEAGMNAGAAYVFERVGSLWFQRAKLTSSSPSVSDQLGASVAFDAGRALVGAPYDDDAEPNAGAAYLYSQGDSGWIERAKLVPAGADTLEGAGASVALRGDVALLGAPGIGIDQPAGEVHALRLGDCAEPFCAGDGSLATACPCGNFGAPGRGCENSAATGGARLAMAGTTAPDTAQLSSSGEPLASLSIFLQSSGVVAGGVPFGDGVRCVSGGLLRLYVRNAAGGVATAPVAGDPSITQRSAALGDPLAPGSVRYYQVHYRDPSLGFCPAPQGSTFNASSGLAIHW